MLKEKLKLILAFSLFVYEEFFLVPAKKLLNKFKQVVFYDKIIDFFSKSIYLNFTFILVIGTLAESSALFAGYLIAHKLFVVGVLFYLLKIILFVPVIDLFKRNKTELLKFKIIRVPYYYYLLFKRLEIWQKVKEIKEKLKQYLKK